MNKTDVPVSDAIRRLVPEDTYGWGVVDDLDISTLTWDNEEVTRPTDSEIDAMRQTIANEITAEEYKDWRANGKYEVQTDDNGEPVKQKTQDGYPSIEEQLDMLWHAIDTESLDKTSDFYINLKAVKDRFPKPSE